MKIEKNIPCPESQRGITHGKYSELQKIFCKMEVGESVLIPLAYENGIGVTATRAGIKVRRRKIETESIRVWKIA